MTTPKKSFWQKVRYKIRFWVAHILKGMEIKFAMTDGITMYLDLRRDVDFLIFMGDFETSHVRMFSTLVKPGGTVIDVGANIGLYSILAAKRTGTAGKVYSFEPSTWARTRLVKNIRLNDVNTIELVPVGVSDTTGIVDFYFCEDDAYNSLGEEPMRPVIRREQIEVVSLDDFCGERNITTVDIIKVDTEGADYLVLKGAKKILTSSHPPILFCEVNKNIIKGFRYTLNEYIQFIKTLGYAIYEIDLSINKLIPFDLEKSQSSEIVCLTKEHQLRFASVLLIQE